MWRAVQNPILRTSLRQRNIDGRNCDRLTRARFAGTNCERQILVHLSQNISNIGITKSDRCRYSRRQNRRWKRSETRGKKRTKTKDQQREKGREKGKERKKMGDKTGEVNSHLFRSREKDTRVPFFPAGRSRVSGTSGLTKIRQRNKGLVAPRARSFLDPNRFIALFIYPG